MEHPAVLQGGITREMTVEVLILQERTTDRALHLEQAKEDLVLTTTQDLPELNPVKTMGQLSHKDLKEMFQPESHRCKDRNSRKLLHNNKLTVVNVESVESV